jgi:hypothetical protein
MKKMILHINKINKTTIMGCHICLAFGIRIDRMKFIKSLCVINYIKSYLEMRLIKDYIKIYKFTPCEIKMFEFIINNSQQDIHKLLHSKDPDAKKLFKVMVCICNHEINEIGEWSFFSEMDIGKYKDYFQIIIGDFDTRELIEHNNCRYNEIDIDDLYLDPSRKQSDDETSDQSDSVSTDQSDDDKEITINNETAEQCDDDKEITINNETSEQCDNKKSTHKTYVYCEDCKNCSYCSNTIIDEDVKSLNHDGDGVCYETGLYDIAENIHAVYNIDSPLGFFGPCEEYTQQINKINRNAKKNNISFAEFCKYIGQGDGNDTAYIIPYIWRE